jgi:hypothetical protein
MLPSTYPAHFSSLYRVSCVAHFHTDGTKCPVHGNCDEQHVEVKLWDDEFHNLVVTEGLNTLLGRTFDVVGSDVNWYVGLIGAGTGTVAITSGAATVTGTSTGFTTELDNAPNADIIIVGAGASGADYRNTVATFSSTTSITVSANAGTTVSGAAYAVEPVASDTMASHSMWNENTTYSNANRVAWTKNGAPSGGAMSNSSSKAAFNINGTTRLFGAFLTNNNTKGGTTGTLYGGGLFTTVSRSVENGDTLNIQIDLSATAS